MKTFILTLLVFNIATAFTQSIANEDLEKLVSFSSSHEESTRMSGAWKRHTFSFHAFYADTIKYICDKNFSDLIKEKKVEDLQEIITYSNLEFTFTVYLKIPVSPDLPIELSIDYMQ